MLQQIGQDMTMTEQQLKVHNMQTKKTVQLKRVILIKKIIHMCIISNNYLRFFPNINQLMSVMFTKPWL